MKILLSSLAPEHLLFTERRKVNKKLEMHETGDWTSGVKP